MKSFRGSHLIDGRFHRFPTGQWQRLRHVSDAQANQCCIGVGGAEGLHPTPDFREQIARLEFEVIAVDLDHRKTEFLRASCYIR